MNPFVRVLQDSRSLAKHTDTHGHTCVYMLCLDVLYCTVAQKNVALSFSLSLSLSVYIYIYICIVIHRQTVSLYYNSSVWRDTRGAKA